MIEIAQRHLRSVVAVMGISLLLVAGLTGTELRGAQANPAGYVFKVVAFLGDPAPGGGKFITDFEPGSINSRGDVVFGADLEVAGDASFKEGVFLVSNRGMSQLARAGGAAPGGGVFDVLLLGTTSLNDQGDAALDFTLSPFSFPVGVNSGAYRYSHNTGIVTPVVVPGVTRAPGGETFAGVGAGPSLNNRGDLVFPGIVPTDKGIHLPDEPYVGLGMGLFKADKKSQISAVVIPGDLAPGGGIFDSAGPPGGAWINDGGDVAFTAHVAGEPCGAPQAVVIGCFPSLYIKKGATGAIRSIAHAGEPAPGGGIFRQAFSPVMNNRGDLVFLGDLTPPPIPSELVGVFLHSRGVTIPVARPGDPMPGGGHLETASFLVGQIHVNNPGEVVFNARLDTDVNGDGSADTGLFAWSHGSLRLVARTGTVIPGVGTIDRLVSGVFTFPLPPILFPNTGAANNDRGEVLFGATLSDGRGVLLIATPKP